MSEYSLGNRIAGAIVGTLSVGSALILLFYILWGK